MVRIRRVAGSGLLATALLAPVGLSPAAASATSSAPHPVTRVTVVGRSSSTVSLSWKNPSATHFAAVVVRAAKGAKAPSTPHAGSAVATVSKRHHAVTAGRLAAGTEYAFALFATDGHGHYARRATVATYTGPAPVASLHGSPTDATIGLSWRNPTTRGFASVVVRYASGRTAPRTPASGTGVHLSRGTATSASILHLAPATSYAFAVWAADRSHRYSTVATTVVTTRPAPHAVSGLTWTAQGATAVRLSWTNPSSPDFTGVVVRRADGNVAPASPSSDTSVTDASRSTTSTTDTDVLPGSTYSYALFAHDAAGHYAAAATVTVTVPQGGAITGTVTGGEGVDVPGVTVWLYPSDGAPQQTTTAGDGTYAFAGLAPDNYAVCFDAHAAFAGSSTGYQPECYSGDFEWIPGGNAPSDPSLSTVVVDDGVTTTDIDAALTPGGTVSGTVTSAGDHHALSGVAVQVFDVDGNEVSDVVTDSGGKYAVTGLVEADGYTVCFDPSSAAGTSSTGYLGQCWSGADWDPQSGTPSDTATPVTVTRSAERKNVDATLSAAGAIKGTVTSGNVPSSVPVAGVQVTIFNSDGLSVRTVSSQADGSYDVLSLAAGTYYACFDGSAVSSPTGYLEQCYEDMGGLNYPTQGTPITVTAGQWAAGVDASLVLGGAVSGTVSANGVAVSGSSVKVLTSAGDLVASGFTGSDGQYTIKGLAASTTYRVCFSGDSDNENDQYSAQCWQHVAWDGMADVAGATAVPVSSGAVTQHVDAALLPQTDITGQVTNEAAVPLQATEVEVFDGSQLVSSATTDTSGLFDVGGLSPLNSGYTVCFDAESAVDGTGDGTTYQSQCYDGIAWSGNTATLPTGTTPVPAPDGTPTQIDAQLTPAA